MKRSCLVGLVLLTLEPLAAQSPDEVRARTLSGLKADVVALVLAGRDGGAFPVAVLAAPGPDGLDLWAEIDGATLLGEEPPESLRLEVYAYALKPGGGVAGYLSEGFRLALAGVAEALATGGIKFAGHLDLAPGSYELRVLVRELRSRRFVLRVQPLTVPEPAAAYVAPPLFADLATSWIRVRGAADDGPGAAALPVLHAGREIAVRLRVHGALADPARARLLDSERRPVADVPLRVAGREKLAGAWERLDVRFHLGEVPTGSYFLEASVGETEEARTASPLVPVFVLGPELTAEEIAWTQIRHLAAEPAAQTEPATEQLAAGQRLAKRRRAIAAAYRRVLDRLATGATVEAVDELFRLDVQVAETSRISDVRVLLAGAQEAVIDALAEHDSESLLPLFFLHLELYERHMSEERSTLAGYNRQRLLALARCYAEGAAEDSAVELAASALVSLGSSLRRSGMLEAPLEAFEEALTLDADHAGALLALGLLYEYVGDYHEATLRLRRLLELRPGSEEGWLRLGMNLHRKGDLDEGRRYLRRVIDSGATDWKMAVAYQELARIHLAGGRLDEAVRLLEEGILRLPREERLFLELAYLLDRSGEPRKAHDLLARAPRRPAAGPTPRFLYGRGPDDTERDNRRGLVDGSLARLPFLARALTATEGAQK